MSVAVRQMYEMVKELEAPSSPWLEIQDKVEKASRRVRDVRADERFR